MDIIRTAEFAISRVVNPNSHMMLSILLDRKASRATIMPLWWTASNFLRFLSLADEYAKDPYSSAYIASI
jgi:hypothetical protein